MKETRIVQVRYGFHYGRMTGYPEVGVLVGIRWRFRPAGIGIGGGAREQRKNRR
jgi:hypothetical protein